MAVVAPFLVVAAALIFALVISARPQDSSSYPGGTSPTDWGNSGGGYQPSSGGGGGGYNPSSFGSYNPSSGNYGGGGYQPSGGNGYNYNPSSGPSYNPSGGNYGGSYGPDSNGGYTGSNGGGGYFPSSGSSGYPSPTGNGNGYSNFGGNGYAPTSGGSYLSPPAYVPSYPSVPTYTHNGFVSSSSSSSASSSGGDSSSSSSSSSSAFFNPYSHLFSFWKPPYLHRGGGVYINQCVACTNYGDAVATGPLNDETACIGFVEEQSDEFLRPEQLKLKTEELIKKNPSDIAPAILQCCYNVYAQQIAKASVANGKKPVDVSALQYPELEGLQKGKTCKDMVHGFLKLLKGDYPQKLKKAEKTDKKQLKQ